MLTTLFGRLCVGLSLVVGVVGVARASTAVHGGGKFSGAVVAAGEVDTWVIPAVAGTKLTLTVKGKGDLIPSFQIVGPAGCGAIDVTGFATGVGSKKPKLKGLPLPVTGGYAVRISGLAGSVGAYQATAGLKIAKALKKMSVAASLPGGGTVAVPFDAVKGALLSVSIAMKKVSAEPRPDRLEGPGETLDLASFVKVSKKSVTAKKVPIPATGSYVLVVRNDGPTDDLVIKLTLKLPKAQKKATEKTGTFAIAGMPLDGTVFPYEELSVEIDAAGLSSVVVEGLVTIAGVPMGGVFFVPQMPLAAGENVLTIRGQEPGGAEVVEERLVVRAVDATVPVTFDAEPRTGHEVPFETTFSIALAPDVSAPVELRIDVDGDGAPDLTSAFTSTVTHAYLAPTTVRPRAFVETCEGLIVSAPIDTLPVLQILPAPTEIPADAFGVAGMSGADLDRHAASKELFVLSAAQGMVHRFDADGAVLQSIAIPGAVSEGMAVADDGDLYVVDTPNDRVVRLTRAAGYMHDLTFGASGFAGSDVPGGLSAPSDCAVARDLMSGAPLVLVADAGNARIVVLDGSGAFVEEFDGDGALVDPGSLVARIGGGAVVVDRGTKSVHWIDADGGDAGVVVDATFTTPGKATRDPATGRVFVGDAGAERVVVLETSGDVERTVTLAGTSVIAAAPVTPGLSDGYWVLGSGSATVRRFTIPDDAPGETPEVVVAGVFTSVLAEDLPALVPVVAPSIHERLAVALGDPTFKAELFGMLQAVGPPEVGWKSDRACRVYASAAAPDETVIELTLVRHAVTAKWVVSRW